VIIIRLGFNNERSLANVKTKKLIEEFGKAR
jgi:hypothetical protein